jgi:hypothetical protein
MRRIFHDESGAVAMLVAILAIVFIALSALVVDMGYMYSVRRQLQAAADAAALAGCQELIYGGGVGQVLDEADHYAQANAVHPGDGLEMLPDPPLTQVTEDSVKVTVRKDVGLFFGRAFGPNHRMVYAQSIAKIAYVTGMKGIVPWSVPIVRARRVTVQLPESTEVDLVDQGSGVWKGHVPVNLAAAADGYPVMVSAYNSQTAYPDGSDNGYPSGVPEILKPASAFVVSDTTSTILNVVLSPRMVTAGEAWTTELTVYLTTPATSTVTARFDGKSYSLAQVPGQPTVYTVTLPVPAVAELVRTLPLDVAVGTGVNQVEIRQAALLVVRRDTYPIKSVSSDQTFFGPSPYSETEVTVELNDFVYGDEYQLKVVGGAGEIGNFCALDLATIKHAPLWRNPQDPSEYDVTTDPDYAPPAYYTYIAGRFPFSVHLNDTIWTNTGALSAPQTDNSMDLRFGDDTRSFEQWKLAGKPGSRRIVFVPVVEKMQNVTGQTPVNVVSFAAFYVDPESGKEGGELNIHGHFLEYLDPSDDLSEEPPDSKYYIQTPHLVSSGLDF